VPATAKRLAVGGTPTIVAFAPVGAHRYNCDMAKDAQPAKRKGTTRRRLFKAALGLAAGSAAVGAYARWVEPTWLHVVEQDLPVVGLSPGWIGARVAFFSDIHHFPWGPPLEYFEETMRRVQSLGADLILCGGDYVNNTDRAYAERAAGLLKGLSAPLGVFSGLGNHDYGVARPVPKPPSQPLAVAGLLGDAGVRVLENESVPLDRGGDRLWLAGIGDYWSGNFRPREALRQVPGDAPVLILCHNPDAAESVTTAGGGTILAGHTHGGQVHIPFIGPPILPVVNRDRYEGLHRVGRSWIYITRGVGWTPWRVRFGCRPEISLLTLRPPTAIIPT
jgi:uncharacterized protein